MRLPYRLERKLSFAASNILRLDYQVENLSAFNLPVLWSAHPLLNCTAKTRLVLPGGSRIINARTDDKSRLGRFGDREAWPIARSGYDMERVGDKKLGLCEKWFVEGIVREGWCQVRHEDTNETLNFQWDPKKIPHLGCWVCEGALGGHYHLAPEPCTAPMDSPGLAARWGYLNPLKPCEIRAWRLELKFEG